jgi:hypothetical protein
VLLARCGAASFTEAGAGTDAMSRELHWCSAAAIQHLTRCRAVEPRQVCPGRGSPFQGIPNSFVPAR